jgi:hypothetical protein
MKKGIREGEREVGGDGVYGCSFGEPLKQETFVFSLLIKYQCLPYLLSTSIGLAYYIPVSSLFIKYKYLPYLLSTSVFLTY